MAITIDEAVTEEFSLDASVAARTLSVVLVISTALLPEGSHNQGKLLGTFPRLGWGQGEPDVHFIILRLNPLSVLDIRHSNFGVSRAVVIVRSDDSTFLIALFARNN